MKRICLALLILACVASQSFAAVATVTPTEWGYRITGGTSQTIVPQNTWVTGTAYLVNNRVCFNSTIYICVHSHTSGNFLTDLNLGYWSKLAPATIWLGIVNFYPSTSTDVVWLSSGPSMVVSGTTITMVSATSAFFTNQYQPSFALNQGNQNQLVGVPFTNLTVTMTSASDIVDLYVLQDNTIQN